MFYASKSLLLLLLINILVHDVSGRYMVQVTFQFYRNPTGRCVNCPATSNRGCCDEIFIRPRWESCSRTCDTGIGYCIRPLGANQTSCSPQQTTVFPQSFLINRNILDFRNGQNLDIIAANPVTVASNDSWRGIQLFMLALNGIGSGGFVREVRLIDGIPIDVNIIVGTSSPQMTYRGFAGIAEMSASFNVKCDAGYYGPDCTNRCQDFRNCADCGLTGFTGEFCQFPIDHCNGVTCSGNGQCQNSPSGFTCACNQDYTGETCETVINHCESVDCSGNGQCQNSPSGFTCACNQGYTGQTCEAVIVNCVCSGNGQCHRNSPSGFTCVCNRGYTGQMCETVIDNCESVNCSRNGQCQSSLSGFTCSCDQGYTGQTCETVIDHCESVDCSGNGQCQNSPSGFTCACNQGYTGQTCEAVIINCACSGNGQCRRNSPSGFTCACNQGYTGQTCETVIDNCESVNCSGNGQCRSSLSGFTCACNQGYTGRICEVVIDNCESVNCSGKGQCQDSPDGVTCTCDVGYTGQICEMAIIKPGINANAGGNAGGDIGGIAGGVVGGLVGVALVFLLIVILLLVITKTRKQKTNSLDRNESGRDVIGPGDNPVYDVGNEQQVMTEGGNNLTPHENGGISENCEERDFDNPLYSSGTLEDGGYYAVPESSTPPPPLYESVVNENPEP